MTLSDLWQGRIAPLEDCNNQEDVQKLLALVKTNGVKMEQMLDEKQRERWGKYEECMHEYYSLLAEYGFIAGFRLGSKLFAQSWLQTP